MTILQYLTERKCLIFDLEQRWKKVFSYEVNLLVDLKARVKDHMRFLA